MVYIMNGEKPRKPFELTSAQSTEVALASLKAHIRARAQAARTAAQNNDGLRAVREALLANQLPDPTVMQQAFDEAHAQGAFFALKEIYDIAFAVGEDSPLDVDEASGDTTS